jgi:metallo-beta-lactamase family protein
MFQGLKELRLLNWMDFPFPPSKIHAVLITHGHLDHVGYLPRLVKQGYNGPIYCTEPTADLTEIVLKDSAKLQEEDAEHANKYGYSVHKPAYPLYDTDDVEKTLPLIQTLKADQFFQLNDEIRFRFRKNAHIPGAAFIELKTKNKTFVFSGDIGRPNDPMLTEREMPEKADILLTESTYGDRLHPKISTEKILKKIINKALERHGPIFVSSFAIDRAQDFMYVLWKLVQKGDIPDLPVYLDSPMASQVSKLFLKYPHWIKLKPEIIEKVFKNVRFVTNIAETYALARDKSPKIIIASSGMMNGGRILHYLAKQLENPGATFILPGYQAVGTRGYQLAQGAEEIKLHGKYFKVKAKVEHIHTMSSHADQKELIQWMKNIKTPPKKVFVVHGEIPAADALRSKLRYALGWKNVRVPLFLQKEPV